MCMNAARWSCSRFRSVLSQRLVALAAAPENVVLAAERLRHLERLLDLRRGVSEDVRVRVRRRAAHVARIGEEIRRAPEQFYAGRFLQPLGVRDELVEVPVRLGQRAAFRRDVAVVEAVEGRLDLGKKIQTPRPCASSRWRPGPSPFPTAGRSCPDRTDRSRRRGTNASRRSRTASCPSWICRPRRSRAGCSA